MSKPVWHLHNNNHYHDYQHHSRSYGDYSSRYSHKRNLAHWDTHLYSDATNAYLYSCV